MTLTPEFDPDTTEYTAATTNATNKVTATATEETAEIEIILNEETEITNGQSATWEEGENVLTITVTAGTETKEYTVTVTAS